MNCVMLTLWRPAAFRDFQKKNSQTHVALRAQEFLCSCSGYGPGRNVKRRGKSSSLNSKKIFAWGMQVFLFVTS